MPAPIPTRPDEFWRVIAEPNMEVIEAGGYCAHHTRGNHIWCNAPAVAATQKGTLLLCEGHLRAGLMWIEKGRVVSWRLGR